MPLDLSRTFLPVNIALLTVSDTRTRENDTSGDLLQERIEKAGHLLKARFIMKDDLEALSSQLKEWAAREDIDVIITTGGTGVTGRDATPEALAKIGDKEIHGFGELFRTISFA